MAKKTMRERLFSKETSRDFMIIMCMIVALFSIEKLLLAIEKQLNEIHILFLDKED